jgi:hypothetical protein
MILYYIMASKQSNKQTQSVKVTVNNKINCCDDKKKKRKPKRKQQAPQEQPVDEFPVLDTQVNARYPQMGIAPMAVRNTVYIPNSSQISPEGMQYPIPSYFDRQYTNLTRTMEDFRDSMMKEIDDVRQTISIRPPPMTDDTQRDFPQSSLNTQTNLMFQEREAPPQQSIVSPVKSMINRFESLGNNDDEEMLNTVEEEEFVSKSPEQSQLYKEYKRLYDIRDETDATDTEGKKNIDNNIREFAQSLGVNIYNENGRLRSVPQLRNDIKNKIKSS